MPEGLSQAIKITPLRYTITSFQEDGEDRLISRQFLQLGLYTRLRNALFQQLAQFLSQSLQHA
jgi:hypothetical protein